jgi:lysophospholipase L1-like esterase
MVKFVLRVKKSLVRPVAGALLFGASLVGVVDAHADGLVLKKGDRVAIVGDSITQQKKYSKFIELYLLACVPELELTMYQFGWSGERAPGFAGRMENDLIPWKPTVVTTSFGMNDGSYRPYSEAIGKKYEDGTSRIQARCKALGARMIVGGPSPVDTDTWRNQTPEADVYYNENLGKLSGIAGRLASANGFVFAGLHPLMMKVMKDAKAANGNKYHVCGSDGVHPWDNGHLVMAYAFLKAMGLDGAIGTVTVDMAGKSTVTEGHRVLSSAAGKVELESSRYPFCFSGKEKDPRGTSSILPFLPFNQDLNRFLLVVKNLPGASADVTWGTSTKTFTKAELETGINLAEAFLDNPFVKPFQHLERIVARKQYRETKNIKGIITNISYLHKEFPKDKDMLEATEVLRSKLLELNAKDAAAARAAVKPVTHTIKVVSK